MPGIELLCQLNPLTAYQFDRAVTTFGRILTNALQEMVETGVGSSRKRVAKYRINELLDERFQFTPDNALDGLTTLEGYEEIG